MLRLDWYILRKMLVTFFYCMLLFILIAVAIDSSEHTDDFVSSGLSGREIIVQYYFGFVPFIWGLLFPLFAFIAVIYFTSRMAVRSEIVAILSSGVSFNRFLRPYIAGGIILALLLYYSSREVIPSGNEIRSEFQVKYFDAGDPMKTGYYKNTYYRRSDSNTYVGIKDFNFSLKSSGVFFLQRLDDFETVYNLRAESMRWDTSIRKWLLTNAVERVVNKDGEIVSRYPACYLDLQIQPEELKQDYYLKDKLTTPRLKKFIETEQMRGSEGMNTFKVERYRRTATSVSVLILTIIGATVASRKTRGGSGLHIALGLVIASAYIMTDRFSTTFSIKGDFPPFIAAWLPNLLFALLAWWLYRKAPK